MILRISKSSKGLHPEDAELGPLYGGVEGGGEGEAQDPSGVGRGEEK